MTKGAERMEEELMELVNLIIERKRPDLSVSELVAIIEEVVADS